MVDMVIPMEDLNDPMDIRFTFKVTNIDDISIWVRSELVAPPVGWAGAAEDHGELTVGTDDYFLNDNYTRTKPATDTSENVTLRISYYSDSGYTTLLSQEDITYTITYVDFNDVGYTVVDDDTFETDLEGWTKTDEAGSTGLARSTALSRSGVASMKHSSFENGDVAYASKSFTIGAVTRAYIRIWLWKKRYDAAVGYFYEMILELITDAGEVSQKRTLPIVLDASPKGGATVDEQWICVAAKLPVNGTYEVRLRSLIENVQHISVGYIHYDDIRVVQS